MARGSRNTGHMSPHYAPRLLASPRAQLDVPWLVITIFLRFRDREGFAKIYADVCNRVDDRLKISQRSLGFFLDSRVREGSEKDSHVLASRMIGIDGKTRK